tara:strand:- start:7264 stop:7776 length:513 start_codon:yes stop_codon:yes gene_type:complete
MFKKFYLNEDASGKKIFCDMDGVITDFDKGYQDVSGNSTDGYEEKYGAEAFWKPINDGGVKWWAELPWMPDGKKLWDFILPYKPTILSAPARGEDCPKGKEIWIKRELGDIPFIFEKDKYKYAQDNHILIDDTKKKIDAWVEHGGIGILHTSADKTIEELRNLLGNSKHD